MIKKSDPCGNSSNWFVDNGLVKGIVVSSILTQVNTNLSKIRHNECYLSGESLSKESSSTCSNNNKSSFLVNEGELDNPHNYVNFENFTEDSEVNLLNKSNRSIFFLIFNNLFFNLFKCCVALYTFEALDEATMSVKEGELLKILQKHDDNMNDEWWFLERARISIDSNETRGYVPSNYVEIVKKNSQENPIVRNEPNKNTKWKSIQSHLSESSNQLNLTDSSFGNESQCTIEYGLAVI